MSKHTPGPWDIERRKSNVTAIGPCVADEYAGHAWLDVTPADARLIAAAPDLLEACISALEELNKYVLTPHPEGSDGARAFCVKVMHIEATIARAKGDA